VVSNHLEIVTDEELGGLYRVGSGWFANEYAGFQQYTRIPAEITAKVSIWLS
jgi:hypothetical protein